MSEIIVDFSHLEVSQLFLSISSYSIRQEEQLLEATATGIDQEVAALLDQGVSIESRGQNGMSVLHWASINGHQGIVSCLFERKADTVLLDWGAYLDAKSNDTLRKDGFNGEHDLELLARMLNATDADGRTALHVASFYGQDATAHLLLDRGSAMQATMYAIHATDAAGRTALDVASTEEVRRIIRARIEEEKLLDAANEGRVEEVAALLDQGVHIQYKDEVG
eukprot:gene29079-38137_t